MNKEDKECIDFAVNKYNKLPLSTRTFIQCLLDWQDCIMFCSECGKAFSEGYIIENGEEYYCSDKCLKKNVTEDTYEVLQNGGDGYSFYKSMKD